MSDGNLLLFGLFMNRIGCDSIICNTLLKLTIFVGSFHVLKCLCYKGNKLTIYKSGYNKYDVTIHVFPVKPFIMYLAKHMHS